MTTERRYFEITTNKEVATQVENFARSSVLSSGRSFTVGKITHHKSMTGGEGYSTIQIISDRPAGIDPVDLFWLGRFSTGCEKDKIIESPRAKTTPPSPVTPKPTIS